MREKERKPPFRVTLSQRWTIASHNGDPPPQPAPSLLRLPSHGSRSHNLSFNRDKRHPYLLVRENLLLRPRNRAEFSINFYNGSQLSRMAQRSPRGLDPTENTRLDTSPFRKRPEQIFGDKEEEVVNLKLFFGYPVSKGEERSKGGDWGREKDNSKFSPHFVRDRNIDPSKELKQKEPQGFPRIIRGS